MKDRIMMIVFVLILGTILSTTLVAVNSFTDPLIARNERIKELSTVLNAFNIDYTKENIDQIFLDNIETVETSEMNYFKVVSGKLAFPFEGAGLWGPIIGVLAMEEDGTTISNVAIKFQEETPGLGSRIAERVYLDTFTAKQFSPKLLLVGAGKAKSEKEIDGITGATLSCKAFIDILNDQYGIFISTFQGD